MKKIGLLILLLATAVVSHAQQKSVQLQAPRPKVGVVLCGGGAKGAAHIGVLKYMEEMGIPVDYVAGTSMGSIIGGLYAAGYSPEELTELISNMDWSAYIGNKIDRSVMSDEVRQRNSTSLINMAFGLDYLFDKGPKKSLLSQLPSAYVSNSSLVNLFNNLCIGYQEDMDFNDMPIPFACVATDMITGQEVVLRSGSLPTAMRASMAIPGVFAPVQIDDMILVDGGLVNNFPADVLRQMGADIIIGVEITSNKKISAEELKSLPQLLGRLVTNATNTKRESNRELCNIHIIPDVSGYGMLSFNPEAIDTLVTRGYKKAQEYHDQFASIKESLDRAAGGPVSQTYLAPKAKNLANDSVLLTSIEITGVPDRQSRWLIRKGQIRPGTKIVQSDIDQAINIYRGTGCFDDITYDVKEQDSLHTASNDQLSDAYGLIINLKPAYPHVLGIGMRYDTEEGAALLLNFGINEKKFGGSKLYLSAKLSYNPRLNATYTYSRSSLANFNLAYDYRNEHFGMIHDSGDKSNLHYWQHKFSGYISQFHLLDFSTAVGVSYMSTLFDRSSMEDENNLYDSLIFKANNLFVPTVLVKYDNLDNAYFAKRGIYTHLASHLYIEPKNQGKIPFDFSFAFKAYLTPGNSRFTFIPQVYGRSVINNYSYYNLWNLVGGEIEGRHFEQQMPFIGISQVYGLNYYAGINQANGITNNMAILRCDVRYNFYGKHYLTAMYNTLMELYTMESAAALDFNHGVGLQYSYNSLLGPISLTGQWSTLTNKFGVYFSIGYTF